MSAGLATLRIYTRLQAEETLSFVVNPSGSRLSSENRNFIIENKAPQKAMFCSRFVRAHGKFLPSNIVFL